MALRDQAGSRQQGFGKSDHKWAERASQHQGSLENHVFVISRICCWHTRNSSHGSPMAKLRIACVYGVQRTVVCMIDCMYIQCLYVRTFCSAPFNVSLPQQKAWSRTCWVCHFLHALCRTGSLSGVSPSASSHLSSLSAAFRGRMDWYWHLDRWCQFEPAVPLN